MKLLSVRDSVMGGRAPLIEVWLLGSASAVGQECCGCVYSSCPPRTKAPALAAAVAAGWADHHSHHAHKHTAYGTAIIIVKACTAAAVESHLPASLSRSEIHREPEGSLLTLPSPWVILRGAKNPWLRNFRKVSALHKTAQLIYVYKHVICAMEWGWSELMRQSLIATP
jgi:hypothetical protein